MLRDQGEKLLESEAEPKGKSVEHSQKTKLMITAAH